MNLLKFFAFFIIIFNSALAFANNTQVPPVLDKFVYKPEHNLIMHPLNSKREIKLYYYEGCDGNAFIYTQEPMDLSVNSWENVKSSIAINGRAFLEDMDYCDPHYYKQICDRFKSDKNSYMLFGAYNKNTVKVFTQKEMEALEKKHERYEIEKLK